MIRICPNCGAEVPPGDVFCPVCAEEIQLVPDYDSISNRIREREMHEQEEQRKKAEALLRAKKEEERKRARRRRRILTAVICIIIIMAVVFILGYRYLNHKDSEFENLYQKAKTEYQAQNYQEAYDVINEALAKDPESISARILKAQIAKTLGKTEEAESLLLDVIAEKPSSKDAYREILDIYMNEGAFEQMRDLMAACTDSSIRMAFAEYICSEPVFSIAPGEYTRELDVHLSSENDAVIYFTADGSEPDENAQLYEGTIHLINGETIINAVAIKPNGIHSTVSSGVFTVKTSGLNPPEVTPASGNYQSSDSEKITVIVPVGCTCYYTFDKRATRTDEVYTGPVDMPEGSHIFYCFIIDGAGEVSQQTIRTYVFRKLAPTPTPTPEPTETPTPTPTPTAQPTATPSPSPTEEGTPTPTEEPTPETTEEPTPAPTEEPTPTPAVTPEVTPEPTVEPENPDGEEGGN